MSRGAAPSSRLRVAGGEAGGRRLDAPRGIRPTQSLVREAIFNVIAARVPDATVLDLFAGSGALGIEALSRGAAAATFVDRDPESVRVVRRNLESLGLADRGHTVRADVPKWLAARPEEARTAAVVLLDPPYNDPVLDQSLALLDALVAPGAAVVVEHAHRQPLPALERLRPVRDRRYGDTSLTLLQVP